ETAGGEVVRGSQVRAPRALAVAGRLAGRSEGGDPATEREPLVDPGRRVAVGHPRHGAEDLAHLRHRVADAREDAADGEVHPVVVEEAGGGHQSMIGANEKPTSTCASTSSSSGATSMTS